MPKEDIKGPIKFLKAFPESVKALTFWLRDFVWNLYPQCNELIYDNYNALAVGFSPTAKAGDAFCSIAVFSNHINFGFNRGSEINDPDKILIGKGNLYRYITLTNEKELPKTYMKKLLKEAYANAIARLKDENQIVKGKTITKSISPVKRRPVS